MFSDLPDIAYDIACASFEFSGTGSRADFYYWLCELDERVLVL